MPNLIDNPDRQGLKPVDQSKDYGYTYPQDLDLRPGRELHDSIVTAIKRRAHESQQLIQKRQDVWSALEKNLTAYVVLADEEQRIKQKDPRKPVRVVVPLSFATLDTLLTYQVERFMNDPMFGFVGTGPEDQIGAALLERVIESQVKRNKIALAMYYMWRDGFVYGFGAVAPRWQQNFGLKRMKTSGLGGWLNSFFGKDPEPILYRDVVYEGNVLDNIDPYMYLPDPNVPISEVQNGEFFGWVKRGNYNKRLSEERDSEGAMFNVRYMSGEQRSTTTLFMESNTGRDRLDGVRTTNSTASQIVDTIYMVINLIPEDWKLGKGRYPEKWLFAVDGDRYLTMAQPLKLMHDMFPVAIFAPDSDGHSVFPVSKLETVYGLQETVDWMLSTHIANVRKSLNDMWLVDPQLINMEDFRNPEPGKIIRLRKSAWGRGVEAGLKQLAVSDVTRQHVQEIPFLADILNRVTGASDIMQGVIRTGGERRSAQEYSQTKASAASRLDKASKIGAIQAHWDIQYMLAKNTQQFMSKDLVVRATGQLGQVLARERNINPQGQSVNARPEDLIDIDFDLAPSEYGSSAGEDPQIWIQLLQMAAGDPELRQNTDITRMFLHAARISGARTVQDFLRNGGAVMTDTMPDEQVANQAKAGNLVPMEQFQNANF